MATVETQVKVGPLAADERIIYGLKALWTTVEAVAEFVVTWVIRLFLASALLIALVAVIERPSSFAKPLSSFTANEIIDEWLKYSSWLMGTVASLLIVVVLVGGTIAATSGRAQFSLWLSNFTFVQLHTKAVVYWQLAFRGHQAILVDQGNHDEFVTMGWRSNYWVLPVASAITSTAIVSVVALILGLFGWHFSPLLIAIASVFLGAALVVSTLGSTEPTPNPDKAAIAVAEEKFGLIDQSLRRNRLVPVSTVLPRPIQYATRDRSRLV